MTKKVTAEERLFFSKVVDFLDIYMRKQAVRSEHTISSYRDALTIFRRYVYEARKLPITKFQFKDCTRDLVLDFMANLTEQGHAPGTVNQRMAALKAYMKFVAADDIELQPIALSIDHIPFLRLTKRIKPVIPQEALAALLDAPKHDRIGMRDRMLLILLYDSAIRLEELLTLKLGNIQDSGGACNLLIHGKGDKERLVPIADKTRMHLRKYLEFYHYGSGKQEYLFYTEHAGIRRQMSHGNVQRIVKKYSAQIRSQFPDLPDSVHPHMFRRTRATEMYQHRVPLEMVARTLGHSSTETTKIYATPSVEMIRDAMNAGNAQAGTDEKEEAAEWEGNEDEIARRFGLR